MKKEKSPAILPSQVTVAGTDVDLAEKWERVVRRRSFLKGLGMATATVSAGALMLGGMAKAQTRSSSGALTKGDADILRFLATAELIESDLWQQYNELGGAHGGNPAYILALQNLDGDMPQYIEDNTDDEISHAEFLNAYLISKGEAPVSLDAFRTLPSSKATGAQDIGRLTNLMGLNVDTSWYTRYRSDKNPDLGAVFKGPVTIMHEPAIPLNDTDTPPDQTQPVPPVTKSQRRMQAIANTAGFHFAFIEQGGSSLYPTMALKVTDPEVLRIVLGIGGVEIDHFGLWHDKAGNAVAQPLAGVTDPETGVFFPDLNNPPTELTQTNKILPEPCDFIQKGTLPKCSVIRPISTTGKSGAVAAIKGFTQDLLFVGQSQAFFQTVMNLAIAADAAQRGV